MGLDYYTLGDILAVAERRNPPHYEAVAPILEKELVKRFPRIEPAAASMYSRLKAAHESVRDYCYDLVNIERWLMQKEAEMREVSDSGE